MTLISRVLNPPLERSKPVLEEDLPGHVQGWSPKVLIYLLIGPKYLPKGV